MTTSQFFCFAALIVAVNAVERAPPTVPLNASDIPVLRQPPPPSYINKQQQNCTLSPVDLTFVVDESGSIGNENSQIIRKSLIALSRSLIIGPTLDRSQLALVKFAENATVVFKLNTYSTNDQVADAINRTSYNGNGTNIASGMNAATNEVFILAAGDRRSTPNIMIVLTDGADKSDVSGAWRAANSKNISVYAIGIGYDIDQEQLKQIAGGNSTNVYNLATFPGLLKIIPENCSNPTTLQPPTTLGAVTPPTLPTTTTTTTTTTTQKPGQCVNGGTPCCKCPPGFTGQYCEAAINSCKNTSIFSHNKNVELLLCGPHGTCHYDPNSGSYCTCDQGWTGPFCNTIIPGEIYISNRCQFNFLSAHPNPSCNSTDRCIADDINCHFSPTPASCRPTAPGWCLPEHIAIKIFKRVGFY